MHVVEDGSAANPRKRFGLCGGRVNYFGSALTRYGVRRMRQLLEERGSETAAGALDGMCAECIGLLDARAEKEESG
jgi:hypothetical protein